MGLVQTTVDAEIKWFQAHQFFFTAAAILGTIIFVHTKYMDYRYAHDNAAKDQANNVLQQQIGVNQKLQAQVEQDHVDYTNLSLQVTTAISQLRASIQARNNQAQTQQTADTKLPPDQLAKRIVTLAPGGTITVEPTGSYSVDQPEAVSVAQKLELVLPLQANVADLQQIAVDKDKQITGLSKTNSDLNQQVGGLNQQITKADEACKANIKTAVDAEKKKHKWYAAAAIVGLEIARVLLTGKG